MPVFPPGLAELNKQSMTMWNMHRGLMHHCTWFLFADPAPGIPFFLVHSETTMPTEMLYDMKFGGEARILLLFWTNPSHDASLALVSDVRPLPCVVIVKEFAFSAQLEAKQNLHSNLDHSIIAISSRK
jgi:hypothetical protein